MGKKTREPMATVDEVATYLRIAPKTLYNWRSKRIGPRSSRIGRRIRYRWTDVEAWAAARATGDAS